MDHDTRAALEAFKQLSERRYRNRFNGMVLFGSRARGDYQSDSDADVAIFLADLNDPVGEQMELAGDAYAVFLESDILVQPWVFGGTPEHPDRNRANHLLNAIETEGINV